MRDEDVPTGAANGVGEIHVLFVTGESVEKQDDGMRACAGGEVEDGVEARVVADDVGSFHRGGEVFVSRGIGGDSCGSALCSRGGCGQGEQERCGRDELGDSGRFRWIHGATFWRILAGCASEKFRSVWNGCWF
jgi:hypothetical protein